MDCFDYRFLDIQSIDDLQLQSIRESIPIYGVVCLKKQSLDINGLVDFTKRMGTPVLLPDSACCNDTQRRYPEVSCVSNMPADYLMLHNHVIAESWHSDGDLGLPGQNYVFSFLYSEMITPIIGGTAFTDLRQAYNSLDQSMREAIDYLEVIIPNEKIPGVSWDQSANARPEVRHAVKQVHRETGQTGLCFGHTLARIAGLPQEESRDIINAFKDAIEKPENQYLHQWEPGDLLIWDNSSVMHKSLGRYANGAHLLYRTQAFMQPDENRFNALIRPSVSNSGSAPIGQTAAQTTNQATNQTSN